jgi:hypothetical protein
MEMQTPLDNGKYVVTMKDNKVTATRHGEPWRDLTGDNLVFHLLMLVADLECRMPELEPHASDMPLIIGSFGWAVAMAKKGNKVGRRGWNGSGMFAYLVPANSYPAQTEMIKGVFEDDIVPYREYWALKTTQNDVAMWSPSGSDSLADDWNIVE